LVKFVAIPYQIKQSEDFSSEAKVDLTNHLANAVLMTDITFSFIIFISIFIF